MLRSARPRYSSTSRRSTRCARHSRDSTRCASAKPNVTPTRSVLAVRHSCTACEITWRRMADPNMSYARQYLAESAQIIEALDADRIERLVDGLVEVRERGGRLFFLGVG